MFKKLILVFVFIIFFSNSNFAYAGVIINEVLYSPVSKQWVEIYNDSDNTINLTEYKILDAGASVNGHNISACSGSLSPNSYAVVAKSPDDFSGSSSVVCKSSLGIKVSEDLIKLKDNSDEIIDSVVIDSIATDGKSSQLIEGSWVASIPTPGEANQSSGSAENDNSSNSDSDTNNSEDTTNNSENSNTSSGSSSKSSASTKSKSSIAKPVKQPSMKAKIITGTLAFAGQPVEIKAEITGFYNENVVLGRIYWNFGDGSSFEQENNFGKFYHTFYHPGEYVLFLEYYSKKSQVPEITNKVSVKVVSTSVSISKIGDTKDFFIELTNNASSDIDVSHWFVNANGKTFILPKNTVIMSKKSMTLSDKVTGFIFNSKPNLKIFSSSGELIFDYQLSNLDSNTIETEDEFESDTEFLPNESEELDQEKDEEYKIEEGDVLENLSGNILSSDTSEENDSNPTYLFLIGFFILLSISTVLVYFLRKKSVTSSAVDDFQILNE